MARVKTFVAGGTLYPEDLNEIEDYIDWVYSQIGLNWAPGDLRITARVSVPTGWLLCQGQAISRATYSALFDAIGTTYGPGNGATTFNVPDFRDSFMLGASPTNPVGARGGEATHTLTVDELPPHKPGLSDPGHSHGTTSAGHTHPLSGTNHPTGVDDDFFDGDNDADDNGPFFPLAAVAGTVTVPLQTGLGGGGTGNVAATTGVSLTNVGAGQAHNNLPPFSAINVQIKT